MRLRFLGGVHPTPNKESTGASPSSPWTRRRSGWSSRVTMCSGGGATPVVKPGDQVTVGQVIATPLEDGVYIHASVSGKVEAIQPMPHPWGASGTPSSSATTERTPPVPTPCPRWTGADEPGGGAGAPVAGPV